MKDPVNNPEHYNRLPIECIEVTKHFNFCLGNALKYVIRCDHKGKKVEDLKKAIWYINQEIKDYEAKTSSDKSSEGDTGQVGAVVPPKSGENSYGNQARLQPGGDSNSNLSKIISVSVAARNKKVGEQQV